MAFGKFGRYYPDGAEVRLGRFDLVELLREEVGALADGPGAGREVRLSSEVDACPLESDRQHVRYVVVNLLHNALKYSPPGTPVDVTLDSADGAASLEVRDRGIGIPPGELDQLFSPFFRASNAGGFPGTGMGLAIVKKSANLIGARLAVETEAGTGTTFTVEFPRSTDA